MWIKTFKRRAPLRQIVVEVERLASEHDRRIARARGGEVIDDALIAKAEDQARSILELDRADVHDFMSIMRGATSPTTVATMTAIEHGGHYVPERMTLTAVHERDKKLYGGSRSERPFEYGVASFVSIIGDKDVREITRADVAEWLAKVGEKQSPATVKRRYGALRGMINRTFLDLEHQGRNPFERHKIEGGSGRNDDRLPFSREMLEKIDSYLDASKRLKPETVNILKLMKATGAGPGEIGGLSLADIVIDGAEIPYVWIRPNEIRGLKNDAVRERRIPLVGKALDAAKDAVMRAKVYAKGKLPEQVQVFQSYNQGERGADSISAKINNVIRRAGIPKSPRLVAYSYRHTMKEALRSAGVADHVQRPHTWPCRPWRCGSIWLASGAVRGSSGRFGSGNGTTGRC